MKHTDAVRRLLLSMSKAARAAAAPALAQLNFNIAPRYDAVPAIEPGDVLAPGYWGWNGYRHIWVRSRTMVKRVGYRWESDHWEQRDLADYRHPANGLTV